MLGGIVLVLAIASGLLLYDALAVRDSLLAAQESLEEVRAAAGDVEIEAAAAALEDADEQLAEARSRSAGPLWTFGSAMPVLGDSVDLTRATVNLATAAVAVADTAIEDGEDIVTAGLNVQVDDGTLDLRPLEDARDLLESLPIERLADARDRLAALDPRWAPDELLAGRESSIALADDAVATVTNGRTLLSALPGFLGTEGPRQYFLGVQTPAELRGTGGMIGYWAVLRVDDGSFELTRSEVYDAQEDADDRPATERIGALSGDLTQGAAVDEEFRDRYDHVAAAAHFSNVNVDPDLPTTAGVALDLFEQRTGDRLDGMVLLDPVAMQLILEAVGAELDLSGQDLPEGAPDTLAAEDFAEYVLVDVYERFGQGQGPQRKDLLRTLGDTAFDRIFDGHWDGGAVGRAMGEASGARHLQIFSRDEEEQASFADLGIAGRLAAPDGADLLSVTANNAVGGKQDVHVRHNVHARIELDDPREGDDGDVSVARSARVRVEVDNPLPSEGMNTYIIGSCEPTGTSSGCFDGPPGQNRTWFSVWAPGNATLRSAAGDDGTMGLRTSDIRGLKAFDRFLTTPSQQTAGFDLTYDGRAPARRGDLGLYYDLAWWGQSKAVPTHLDVTFAAPEGWRVADVTVTGPGPDAPVLFGETEQLAVEAGDGDEVRVTGTVAGDARLRVFMDGA